MLSFLKEEEAETIAEEVVVNGIFGKLITAKIVSSDQFGEMLIKFSENMRTSINLTSINHQYLDIYVLPSNNWTDYEPFNVSKLNFTWTVTSFKKDQMIIKMDFVEPNFISLKIL